MDRIDITEAQILEELLAAFDQPAHTQGITTVEIMERRGLSKDKALRLIKRAVIAGKLRPAMVMRGPDDGPHWMFKVPVKGYVRV